MAGNIVAFVGRIQPLKAPDVLLPRAGRAARRDPAVARDLTVVISAGPSGTGLDRPTALIELADIARRRRLGAVPAAADR